MVKLLITNGSGTVDVTQLIQTISWSGDYQQCSRTLQFQMISSASDLNIPNAACALGDGVVLMQDEELLFSGYIFERNKNTGSSFINITCYDKGIYLKRNESSYKFTSMTPEAITKRICADFDIPTGNLAAPEVKLTRNFIGVSLYKMIQTAYTLASETTGGKYLLRFNGEKLDVIEKKVTDKTLVIESGVNLISASTTESVADMVNQVAVYNKEDELVGVHNDPQAVKAYGLLQSYIKKAEGADDAARANEMMADRGLSQKITIENMGNTACLAGGTVVVREPYTGLYGLFYIDSDVHTWKSGQYTNQLVINFKNMMDELDAGSLK